VSSPGLDRPLKKDRDFARSIGKDVEIRFYRQIDGVKELTGSLSSYSADTVTVRLEDGSEKVLNRSDIARIRLAFYF
jgi:ribosome maturation factor RimP